MNYISNLEASPYLQHYGILGMHWGVRRYQNADGSLTAEGRSRKKTKREKTIDRGYKLYQKGDTVTDSMSRSANAAKVGRTAVSIGTAVGGLLLRSDAVTRNKYGKYAVGVIAAAGAVELSSLAYRGVQQSKQTAMRTYWHATPAAKRKSAGY